MSDTRTFVVLIKTKVQSAGHIVLAKTRMNYDKLSRKKRQHTENSACVSSV